jgi:hypothetical protein
MAHKDPERRLAYQRAYRLRLGIKPRTPRPRRTTCLGCGEPLRPRCMKYCSTHCQRESEHREYIRRWLAGEVAGGSVAMVSGRIRRYLIEQGGEKCSSRGWNQRNAATGRVPLEIHHLNGNYAHNRPFNIRLVCPNCHSLTPTYRALNKGSGRPWAVVRRDIQGRRADGEIRTHDISLTRRTLYP